MTDTMVPPTVSANAVEGLYATGHWLYSQNSIEHARSVFRAMIHIAPDDERGWLALGACHEAQEQHDIALELYGVAIATAPAAPRCEIARARVLRMRGREDEALDALDEAARLAVELRDEDLQTLVASERGRT
jgi:tetratricopeptide (TPR) repeat protein